MSTPQLVVDYSTARPDPVHIKNVGYFGVMRYLSHTPAKNLTPAERDQLVAAGLAIGLVWETVANRVLSGTSGGQADSNDANTQADALGFPTTLPIYYAVDFDAQPNQFPTIEGYLLGCRGRRPVGVYGGIHLIDNMVGRGIVSFGWQTVAWSGGAVSTHACLYQRGKPTLGPIPDTDENVVIGAAGLWLPPGAAPLPTPVRIPAYPGYVLQLQKPLLNTPAVTQWQMGMATRGWRIAIDGVYGPASAAVCKQFQTQQHLTVDGKVGPVTWRTTWQAPIH